MNLYRLFLITAALICLFVGVSCETFDEKQRCTRHEQEPTPP